MSWIELLARYPTRLALCVAIGALMALATPPMDVYPMAWFGLVAFSWILAEENERNPRGQRLSSALRLLLLGLVFGIGTNLVALRFIPPVIARFTPLPTSLGPVALLVLAAFEASRWVAAAGAYWLLVRVRVPRSLAFAVGVYAGTFVPTMIPWTVACGVCPWPATVQLAEFVGERGVALLMALEAALVAEGFRRIVARANDVGAESEPRAPPIALAACLLGASLLYGHIRIRQVDALRAVSPEARIALVTPAVAASRDNEHTALSEEESVVILQRLTLLTRQAEHDGAELVIWPEAAHPFSMLHVSRHAPTGAHAIVQPSVRGPLLTGIIMTGDLGKYNSAVLATRDGMIAEPYDKVHLLWFGEFVPFSDSFPWLRKAFGRGMGFRAGERAQAFDAGPVRAAVLICLEDILPSGGREAMSTKPNLLVNVTNDSWFEGSAESELHLRLATLRTIESRRDLVRAVNGGPTSWIDASGRIVARLQADTPGLLMARPALIDAPPTTYAAWGDGPLAALAGVTITFLGIMRHRRPPPARRGSAQAPS
jgi:apolipoprotein N-acyltransferase